MFGHPHLPPAVDTECFATSITVKPAMISSTSEVEHSVLPEYVDTICSLVSTSDCLPSEYTKAVHSDTDRPTSEYSDPECYFDCKQAASDLSETEPDEPILRATSSRVEPHEPLILVLHACWKSQ